MYKNSHLAKAMEICRRFPANDKKNKKNPGRKKVEFPMGGMTCLLLEATGSLRLQGRQYYIQCNREHSPNLTSGQLLDV